MVSAAVDLQPSLVVNVDILFLRRRKVHFIVEKGDVFHGFANLRRPREAFFYYKKRKKKGKG